MTLHELDIELYQLSHDEPIPHWLFEELLGYLKQLEIRIESLEHDKGALNISYADTTLGDNQ